MATSLDRGAYDQIDPESISRMGKLHMDILEKIQGLLNPTPDRPASSYYAATRTEAGEPIVGWQDSRTPITGFKPGLQGGNPTRQSDADWHSQFQPKLSTPNFWSTRAPATAPTSTTLLPPPIRYDKFAGPYQDPIQASQPHVQIDPRYGGGEGSVRYLPKEAPGFINGRQVEGTPGAEPYPLSGSATAVAAWRKKYLGG